MTLPCADENYWIVPRSARAPGRARALLREQFTE